MGNERLPSYPAKLAGVAFAAQNRPLALTERHPLRQVIRFKDIVTFDADKKSHP